MAEDKAVFTESTSTVAQKEMLDRMHSGESYVGAGVTLQPGQVEDQRQEDAVFATETTDTSGYVGVDPVYMTHASDTEAPLVAEGGPEEELLDLHEAALSTEVPESEDDEEPEPEAEEPTPVTPTSTPASGGPSTSVSGDASPSSSNQ